jgi:large subunit ribosomal protein L15
MFRRMPKRGFSNFKFAQRYEIVNVSQLERFEDGSDVSLQTLCNVGLINSCDSRVKILGGGALTKRLQVAAHRFSKSAEQKITGCGGTVQVI